MPPEWARAAKAIVGAAALERRVTEEGFELLSAGAPRKMEEIEALIGTARSPESFRY